VVLFHFGEQALLFPGDAQWGNWQSWLDKNGNDVLANVTFYKVAHHGSVNATPKSALDAMQHKKLVAMASTQSKPWPSIPAPKLVNALNTRTGDQYVQSDSIKVSGAPFKSVKSVPSRFKKGDLWYDYFA
jgi:beta-lactamase superfamily II metal-dependent hydrolase